MIMAPAVQVNMAMERPCKNLCQSDLLCDIAVPVNKSHMTFTTLRKPLSFLGGPCSACNCGCSLRIPTKDAQEAQLGRPTAV